MRRALVAALFTTFVLPIAKSSAQWTSKRADGHAPIGVMLDHMHEQGEFMFSYRFMYMGMEGSRVDSDKIADADIISPTGQNFLITPTKMPMAMHMLGMMYAPTDRVTLMVMANYIDYSMDHITRAGGAFSTGSAGLGDTKVSAMIGVADWDNNSVHVGATVSIPTGSIEKMDVTPLSAPNKSLLPYPMQLGSGTFDLQPSVTYLGQQATLSWGGQVQGVFRLGENDSEYTLGNVYGGTVWFATRIGGDLSASLRLAGKSWGSIDGANPAFAGGVNNRLVPTVFTDTKAGLSFSSLVGVNYQVPSMKALRFAIEGGIPFVQNLDGPQMEIDFEITAGIQYSFGGHKH